MKNWYLTVHRQTFVMAELQSAQNLKSYLSYTGTKHPLCTELIKVLNIFAYVKKDKLVYTIIQRLRSEQACSIGLKWTI